jgi:hypothetical protein
LEGFVFFTIFVGMEQPEKNIKYLVLSTISRLKKMAVDTADYVWLLEIAMTFYSEKLRGFNMPTIEAVEIPVNLQNRVWAFPSDFLAISRVAYKRDGHLWDLTVDTSIDFTEAPTPCEQPEYNTDNHIYVNPYIYGGYAGHNYGMRGALNVNYYRINWSKRQIIFHNIIPVGTGVVEYISAGKDICETTLVPLPYVDAFRKYLIWQAFEYSGDDKLMRQSKDKERQFNDAMWDSNSLAKGGTIREYIDAINEGTSFNLK